MDKNIKKIIKIALLTFSSGPYAATTCSVTDLQGEWEANYFFSNPRQVGTCTLKIDNSMKVTGNCENATFGTTSEIIFGDASISSNCVVKGTAYADDGDKIIIKAKASADKQSIKGSVVSVIGRSSVRGVVDWTKTGGLSCQVVPK